MSMFIPFSSADTYKVAFHHNVLPQPCDISANCNSFDYGFNMSSQITDVFLDIFFFVDNSFSILFPLSKNVQYKKPLIKRVYLHIERLFNRSFALIFEGFVYFVFPYRLFLLAKSFKALFKAFSSKSGHKTSVK